MCQGRKIESTRYFDIQTVAASDLDKYTMNFPTFFDNGFRLMGMASEDAEIVERKDS